MLPLGVTHLSLRLLLFSPAGHLCPSATTTPNSCPLGHYVNRPVSHCWTLEGPHDSWTHVEFALACSQCPRGTATAIACPAGTFTKSDNLSTREGCSICPIGYSCKAGTSEPEPCSAGRFGATLGQRSRDCSAACPKGHFCVEGSTSNTSGICRARILFERDPTSLPRSHH